MATITKRKKAVASTKGDVKTRTSVRKIRKTNNIKKKKNSTRTGVRSKSKKEAKSNNNAKKSITLLQLLLDTLNTNDSIITFMELCNCCGLSEKKVNTIIADDIKTNDIVAEQYELINNMIETRILKTGLTTGSAPMSIFVLKNKYDYKDTGRYAKKYGGDTNSHDVLIIKTQ